MSIVVDFLKGMPFLLVLFVGMPALAWSAPVSGKLPDCHTITVVVDRAKGDDDTTGSGDTGGGDKPGVEIVIGGDPGGTGEPPATPGGGIKIGGNPGGKDEPPATPGGGIKVGGGTGTGSGLPDCHTITVTVEREKGNDDTTGGDDTGGGHKLGGDIVIGGDPDGIGEPPSTLGGSIKIGGGATTEGGTDNAPTGFLIQQSSPFGKGVCTELATHVKELRIRLRSKIRRSRLRARLLQDIREPLVNSIKDKKKHIVWLEKNKDFLQQSHQYAQAINREKAQLAALEKRYKTKLAHDNKGYAKLFTQPLQQDKENLSKAFQQFNDCKENSNKREQELQEQLDYLVGKTKTPVTPDGDKSEEPERNDISWEKALDSPLGAAQGIADTLAHALSALEACSECKSLSMQFLKLAWATKALTPEEEQQKKDITVQLKLCMKKCEKKKKDDIKSKKKPDLELPNLENDSPLVDGTNRTIPGLKGEPPVTPGDGIKIGGGDKAPTDNDTLHQVRFRIETGVFTMPRFGDQCIDSAFAGLREACLKKPSDTDLQEKALKLSMKMNRLAESFARFQKRKNHGAAAFIKKKWRKLNEQYKKQLEAIKAHRSDFARCQQGAEQQAKASCKKKGEDTTTGGGIVIGDGPGGTGEPPATPGGSIKIGGGGDSGDDGATTEGGSDNAPAGFLIQPGSTFSLVDSCYEFEQKVEGLQKKEKQLRQTHKRLLQEDSNPAINEQKDRIRQYKELIARFTFGNSHISAEELDQALKDLEAAEARMMELNPRWDYTLDGLASDIRRSRNKITAVRNELMFAKSQLEDCKKKRRKQISQITGDPLDCPDCGVDVVQVTHRTGNDPFDPADPVAGGDTIGGFIVNPPVVVGPPPVVTQPPVVTPPPPVVIGPPPVAADTTPPVVTAPFSITVLLRSFVASSESNGSPVSNAAIQTFLNGASATDNIGVVGGVSNNAPAGFIPVKPYTAIFNSNMNSRITTVTFTARDAAGNVGTATSFITVVDFGGPSSNAFGRCAPFPIHAPLGSVVPITDPTLQTYINCVKNSFSDNVDGSIPAANVQVYGDPGLNPQPPRINPAFTLPPAIFPAPTVIVPPSINAVSNPGIFFMAVDQAGNLGYFGAYALSIFSP